MFGREITVPRAEKQKNIISGTSVHPFPDELLLHGLLGVERMCHLSMSSVSPCFRVSVSPCLRLLLYTCPIAILSTVKQCLVRVFLLESVSFCVKMLKMVRGETPYTYTHTL